MKLSCCGCGIEKDTDVYESYPYPEDGIIEDKISPLFVLEVQRLSLDWKAAIVCFDCFHKLEPDLWISANMWEEINPVVSYDNLPEISKAERFKPESYFSKPVEA